jgi:hypothetical protein
MIVELTLISTFIIHHLMLGLFISGALWLLFKMPWSITPQARDFLWFTSYMLVTLLPFAAFLSSDNSVNKTSITTQTPFILPQLVPKPLAIDLTMLQSVNGTWHVPQSIINSYSPLISLLLILWLLGILWHSTQLAFKLTNSHFLALNIAESMNIKVSDKEPVITIWLSHQ